MARGTASISATMPTMIYGRLIRSVPISAQCSVGSDVTSFTGSALSVGVNDLTANPNGNIVVGPASSQTHLSFSHTFTDDARYTVCFQDHFASCDAEPVFFGTDLAAAYTGAGTATAADLLQFGLMGECGVAGDVKSFAFPTDNNYAGGEGAGISTLPQTDLDDADTFATFDSDTYALLLISITSKFLTIANNGAEVRRIF